VRKNALFLAACQLFGKILETNWFLGTLITNKLPAISNLNKNNG